jgi:hypothetical protein
LQFKKSGALLENEVGKMCSRPSRELDLHFNEFALHFKIAKTEGVGPLLEDEAGKICARQ